MAIHRNTTLQNHARELRQNMTDAERRLWRYLRAGRFHNIKSRRQYAIGHYIVDFVAVETGLIIELDGGQHATQQTYDQQRTEFLQKQGYRVLRFWNHDVLQRTETVLAEILKHCQKSAF